MADPLRILSVDGGGIRGLIPALVLARLEEELVNHPETGADVRLADYFHLFAGTSTGGLIALALTAPGGVPATELSGIYVEDGPEIFKRDALLPAGPLAGLFGPLYGAERLAKSLAARLGESLVSKAKRDLLVTAYDMTERQPFFFKRWRAVESEDHDYPIVDAGLATSAAPTYFPSHGLRVPGDAEPHALVDGGVFADDPTVAAIAEALGRGSDPPAGLAPHDLFVVSLGTSRYVPRYRQEDVSGWGKIRWVVLGGAEPPLISAMLNGSADGTDYWAHMLLNQEPGEGPPNAATIGHGPRYYRLQVEIPVEVAMDDASERVLQETLPDAADRLIDEHDEDLKAIVSELASLGPIPPLT
ncbi:MAG: patatin-like phospholipase family protein [Chloroflexota bacterium]